MCPCPFCFTAIGSLVIPLIRILRTKDMSKGSRLSQITDYILKNKRKYASYILIIIGMAGLADHLLTSGFTWDVEQGWECHGFWLGILPIIIGFLLGARWRRSGKKNK